ncbi:hypothetical protein M446_6260 [Methylobacterium sp. 4-46]|uniref:hypothetical protein n=1 Tax=unclassified Methylobacterium TaxID=2615210 RepID=UPI000165CB32|nr:MULTISPECIES: hypothetical protein [Methylobacterium]ACA20526.1 hypothetical protein M446_6260 [Methylobacterium sp. 4-46]WFT79692.1 hypothetical protein QA634_31615 [Methylobacterium nodulans]
MVGRGFNGREGQAGGFGRRRGCGRAVGSGALGLGLATGDALGAPSGSMDDCADRLSEGLPLPACCSDAYGATS